MRYGGGWTGSLQEVVRALRAFHEERLAVAGIEERFSWFELAQHARSHEEGPAAFTAATWRTMGEWLRKDPADHGLFPLLEACRRQPRLSLLFPFYSMGALCFSRVTGAPFTGDCPFAFCGQTPDLYHVQAPGKGRRPPFLQSGDAVEAASALEQHLPADCAAARHGTAEQAEGRIGS